MRENRLRQRNLRVRQGSLDVLGHGVPLPAQPAVETLGPWLNRAIIITVPHRRQVPQRFLDPLEHLAGLDVLVPSADRGEPHRQFTGRLGPDAVGVDPPVERFVVERLPVERRAGVRQQAAGAALVVQKPLPQLGEPLVGFRPAAGLGVRTGVRQAVPDQDRRAEPATDGAGRRGAARGRSTAGSRLRFVRDRRRPRHAAAGQERVDGHRTAAGLDRRRHLVVGAVTAAVAAGLVRRVDRAAPPASGKLPARRSPPAPGLRVIGLPSHDKGMKPLPIGARVWSLEPLTAPYSGLGMGMILCR